MKKKITKNIVVVVLCVFLVWWFFPRHVLPPRENVSEIVVSSGLSGKSRSFVDEEVDELYNVLGKTYGIRIFPKLFPSGGFSYSIDYLDHDGNQHHNLTLYEGGLCTLRGINGFIVGKGIFGSLNQTLLFIIEQKGE